MKPTLPENGVITARTCPTCGHHEIGYLDADNTFHPLRPGDRVQVLPEDTPEARDSMDPTEDPAPTAIFEDAPVELAAWAPSPLMADRALRLKFGVLVNPDLLGEDMPAGLYGIAFRQKLQRLIDAEQFVPLPVIFDRFFGVPQLAAGDSLQMTESLMEELEEFSAIPERVQDWLARKDDESLRKLIHPKSPGDLGEDPVDHEQLKQELEGLTLEDFFDML